MTQTMSPALRRRETVSGYLFLLPSLVFFVGFVVVPMVMCIVTSFFDANMNANTPDVFIGLANYKELWQDKVFLKALRNTFIIVLVSVPVVCIFSLWVASAIYQMKEFSLSFYRVVFYLPVVTGSVAVTVVWKWMYNNYYGIFNYLLKGAGLISKNTSCVEDIFRYHVKDELGCVLENVGPDGEARLDFTEGRIVNPGHDIEGVWFLLEHAKRTGDGALVGKAETIFNRAINAGWDKEYGGLLYFIDCLGRPPEAYEHDMKLWWPHDEILISSLMLYRDTGKEEYLDWFFRTLEYCQNFFSDPEYGEWYGYSSRGYWNLQSKRYVFS